MKQFGKAVLPPGTIKKTINVHLKFFLESLHCFADFAQLFPIRVHHDLLLVFSFLFQGRLERYMTQRLPSKVKLLRLPRRSGLIRARLAGAGMATGDVLVFLDSHCECGYDWIQPLLQVG